MPGAPKTQVLPPQVNPRKFAFQGTVLEGTIPVNALTRFQSAVEKVHAPIDAKLHFQVDDNGKPILNGEVSVAVELVCQRCLENVVQTIEADIRLAMVISEEQSKSLSKDYDPWLVDSEEGVADLFGAIEDELLLALPMVAYHSDPCIDASLLSSKDPKITEQIQSETASPFKVLEQLKIAPKK